MAITYRPDIDGLRAISILLVVGFHSGISWLAGGYVGVDVFFVISGFLITGLIIDEVEKTGGLSFSTFLARRIRRLLPMASLVLATTLLAGMWIVPTISRATLIADVRAAALYVSNWRFATMATAYADTSVTDSLVLHYWSLSIEEQFYLLWPLLIVAMLFLTRRIQKQSPIRFMAATITSVSLLSLGLSIGQAYGLGPATYFFTHTRIWEMGVGAGLAFVVPHLDRVGSGTRQILGVAGLTMILAAATVFNGDTPFPGYAAILPVAGAATVLVAGTLGSSTTTRALSLSPLPRIGKLSYGWYLWHWPTIGIALLVAKRLDVGIPEPAVVTAAVVFSLGLASITYRLIENPIRHATVLRSAPRRAFAMGAILSITPIVLGAGLALLVDIGGTAVALPDIAVEETQDSAAVAGSQDRSSHDEPSPASTGDDPEGTVALPVAMTPREAQDDWSEDLNVCRSPDPDTFPDPDCTFGSVLGSPTIALIGDSHADHWFPAFRKAAEERSWRLLAFSKSSCSVVDVPLYAHRFEREYHECAEWRQAVLMQLKMTPNVDMVVIGRSWNYRPQVLGTNGEIVEPALFVSTWTEGAARTYTALQPLTKQIVQLRDTPWSPSDVPACLAEHPQEPDLCAFADTTEPDAKSGALLDTDLVRAEQLAAASTNTIVHFLDPTPAICTSGRCPVVTDRGIIVFKDRHHMTESFSETLSDWIANELDRIIAMVDDGIS